MYIILKQVYENGSRPALQTWNESTAPEGFAFCPDEFYDVFYSTDPAGFVYITVEDDYVTEMTINQEALDAYIASLPDPEPIPEPEGDVYDEMAAAITEGVNEV